MSKTAAQNTTPQNLSGRNSKESTVSGRPQQVQFVRLALTMAWQLALVVLIPILVGVQLDKTLGTSFVCTFVGLAVAFIGSGFVMWRAVQSANNLPVPTLSDKQKRAIKKQYEEDDKD